MKNKYEIFERKRIRPTVKKIQVWTDASGIYKNGKEDLIAVNIAFIIREGEEIIFQKTTQLRNCSVAEGEKLAAISGMYYLKMVSDLLPCEVVLYSDYLENIRVIEKKKIKNKLDQALVYLAETIGTKVKKVPSDNNIAHDLAYYGQLN